jgi:hypothetical protein
MSVLVYAQDLKKKYLQNETYTYYELLTAYQQLAAQSEWVDYHTDSLETDAGIKVPIIQVGQQAVALEHREIPVMLILNGIHAGESCGVDASLHWVEDMIRSGADLSAVSIYIIPIYNVGGSMNRSCCTRANQNGPKSKGFRGNANNLDLNRDFIKCDSRNALSFNRLFQAFEPDVLIDTHSTNGADYQYHMTLIPYNWEKWPLALEEVGRNWFERVKEETNKEVPTQYYVNVWGKTPESGFTAFEVTSIYSGGYAGLFNTLNFTAEAHMFKTYPERVEATMVTLQKALEVTQKMAKDILQIRQYYDNKGRRGKVNYYTKWTIDSTKADTLDFLGYQAEFYTSPLTRQPTYRYNRDKPVVHKAPFYTHYKPVSSVSLPSSFYLHAGNKAVIERLKANKVPVSVITDTFTLRLPLKVYYVDNNTYAKQPYEGHFVHQDYTLREEWVTETFYPGDYQVGVNRYTLEVFEPETPGSFFRWNFFDTYLQQKEWFSSYIFEEKAIAFLAENPEIKAEFEKKRAEDEAFSNNHFAQLYWIYRQTPYYEKEHMRIPVFKSIRTRL